MEQPDEDLRKRGEKYFRDMISEEPDLFETLDSELIDYEKLITTHIPVSYTHLTLPTILLV